MPLLEALDRYFASWNDHDPEGLMASLTEDGTYEDPNTGGPVSREKCAGILSRLLTAFPDLSFDVVDIGPTSDTTAYARWVMRGTNTGPGPAGSATGRKIALSGADFIEHDPEPDLVARVVGYFDPSALLRQLGLQVHITLGDLEWAAFGTSVRVDTQRTTIPGAFTITWIDVDDDHAPVLSNAGLAIVTEQLDNDAFLGTCFATVGQRHYTFTAWESVDSARAALRGGAHAEAMRLANRGGMGENAVGITSIWKPEVLNGVFRPGASRAADLSELGGQWL